MANEILNRLERAIAQRGQASSDHDLNPDIVLAQGRKLRSAGVLIPVMLKDDRAEVILTKRSSSLRHHPGQIAFPGGKQEETDADVTRAALREAQEEIGLDPENTRVLGHLPVHETVTGFIVTPVLSQVLSEFEPTPEAGEVDEVFRVPLDYLMRPQSYSVQQRRWRGHWRRYYTVPYGPYYIWGATARMLRGLADAWGRA